MDSFRTMDEMEMSINLQAIRLAWVYGLLFLLVWIGYEWMNKGLFNGIAFILMTSQLVIFWIVQLFLKWKLGKNEK
ncbi:MAG: hypothetical protein ACOX6L_11720 [Syntrophomonadaceae bacterium]